MVANAHGTPLCKHSRPSYLHRTGGLRGQCNLWCEWRMISYTVLLPWLVLMILLFVLVPHDKMSGFQPTGQ